MLVSHDAQTVIRIARKPHRCDCRLRAHHGYDDEHDRAISCQNVIQPGEQYPEYLGESPAYQSGHRFCNACWPDQLGGWVTRG